jgi:hypothetical protein
MLSKVRSLVARAYGDLPMTIEEWAVANSRHAEPDDIIAAAIAQSFAKNFHDWIGDNLAGSVKEAYSVARYSIGGGPDFEGKALRLRNSKTAVNISLACNYTYKGSKEIKFFDGLYVNSMRMSRRAERVILIAYARIKNQIDAIKVAEQQALESMKRGEVAWDLAERLLNMKRNEHGALVPVVEVCDADSGPSEQSDTALRGSGDHPFDPFTEDGSLPTTHPRNPQRNRPASRVRDRGTSRGTAVSA